MAIFSWGEGYRGRLYMGKTRIFFLKSENFSLISPREMEDHVLTFVENFFEAGEAI